MAAFTAAKRDFAAALPPVGLTGAPDAFWEEREKNVDYELRYPAKP